MLIGWAILGGRWARAATKSSEGILISSPWPWCWSSGAGLRCPTPLRWRFYPSVSQWARPRNCLHSITPSSTLQPVLPLKHFQVPGHLKKNVTMAQKQIKLTCLDNNCNVFSVSILILHLMNDIRFTLHIMSLWSGFHYRGPLEQSRYFFLFIICSFLCLYISLWKKIKRN